MNTCQMCRQPVGDICNDCTMIDYLQREQSKKDSTEQAIMRSKLPEMSDNAKKTLAENAKKFTAG